LNTPLIKINYRYKGKEKYIYTKLESYNITGSIKDRAAFYIINKAKQRGELKDNMPIVEATSGNTGIALSALGTYYGHPVHLFMPYWVREERIKIMKMYNAKVTLISKEQGGFLKCIEEAEKLAKKLNGFWANQFSNLDNVLAHYETTGKEIIEQVPTEIGGFVSGIGTGGTLMGVAKKLKENYPNIIIAALEPDKMPILSKNMIIGTHAIEGIGDEFIPSLVERQVIDDIILINDLDAINMSRKIASNLGIGVGISSGANLLASVLLQERIESSVVTIFVDDNKKYLSTQLSKPIDEAKELLSNKIELISYTTIREIL